MRHQPGDFPGGRPVNRKLRHGAPGVVGKDLDLGTERARPKRRKVNIDASRSPRRNDKISRQVPRKPWRKDNALNGQIPRADVGDLHWPHRKLSSGKISEGKVAGGRCKPRPLAHPAHGDRGVARSCGGIHRDVAAVGLDRHWREADRDILRGAGGNGAAPVPAEARRVEDGMNGQVARAGVRNRQGAVRGFVDRDHPETEIAREFDHGRRRGWNPQTVETPGGISHGVEE